MAQRSRTALLYGGPSTEHDVSIDSASTVARALEELGHELVPVFIDRESRWFVGEAAPLEGGALSTEARPPVAGLLGLIGERPDNVFLALHGTFGEDGVVQAMLESAGLPYTGSHVAASAITFDKWLSKEVMRSKRMPTPAALVVKPEESLESVEVQIEKAFGFPCFIKPRCGGSSVGAACLRKPEDLDRFWTGDKLPTSYLIEELIAGRELTVGIAFIDGRDRALAPIEIRPKTADFFDYEAKYTPGATAEICPAPIEPELTRRISRLALDAHQLFGCWGFSRVDFIERDGVPYFLEINTTPGLTKGSLLPKMLAHQGIDMKTFVGAQLELSKR